MSRAKLKVTVLALTGLVGTALGWLAIDPGRGDSAGPPAAKASEPDSKARTGHKDGREERLTKAKAELRRLVEEAEALDRKLSGKVIEARQQMVDLEEQLRQSEAPVVTSSQARCLRDQIAKHEANIEAHLARGFRRDYSPLVAVRAKVDSLQKQLAALEAESRRSKEKTIDLRKQMIRQEEDIRLLERKRAIRREEADRNREAAAEKIRQLAGGPAIGGPDRVLRDMATRLEALQGEIASMRREVQRLRAERKK